LPEKPGFFEIDLLRDHENVITTGLFTLFKFSLFQGADLMTRTFKSRGLGQRQLVIMAGLLPFLCGGYLLANEDSSVHAGKELFQREWVHEAPMIPDRGEMSRDEYEALLKTLPGDGLGPMFNATSCESCHVGGGAAGVDHNVTLLTLDPRNKFDAFDSKQKARQALLDLYPGVLAPGGALLLDVVVHEKSSRFFYDGIREGIGKQVYGGVSDQWFKSSQRTIEAVAENPVLAGRVGQLDFYLSQRNSPPLYGLGLIDRIDRSRLTLIARTQARRTNGAVTGRLGAGKFGWRAQTPTLDGFVRGACAGELGLQVGATPQSPDLADASYVSLGVDMDQQQVSALTSYVRSLPHPQQETRLPEQAVLARKGKELFKKIGCNDCHVEHISPARGIFSDLLLHDMGALLQAPSPAPAGSSVRLTSRIRTPNFPPDRLPLGSRAPIASYYGSTSPPTPYPLPRPLNPQFPRGKLPSEKVMSITPATWDSLQREWRTPPLWGVADSAPYLHDGRASTLDAAIRWHGGEASQAATNYRTLTREDRKKVIAFLASLRAPAKASRQQVDQTVEPVFASVRTSGAASDAQQQQELVETLSVFDPGL
jgi:CxxC motif-containing protein (DUF1111 family)